MPFHIWTPDVYQGSPTPVTGFMAAVAKAAGFAGADPDPRRRLPHHDASTGGRSSGSWPSLTLLVGSVLAIVQTDVKRMLAYSSISHAGYVLVGVQAAIASGAAGALFYLLAYTFMVIGSFAIVAVVGGKGEARNDLGGLPRPGLPPARAGRWSFTVLPAGPGRRAVHVRVLGQVLRDRRPRSARASTSWPCIAMLRGRHRRLLLPAAGHRHVLRARRLGARVDGGVGAVAGAGVAGGHAGRADVPRIVIPVGAGIALAICVVFTIVVGVVPSPVIDFARHATLLF